MKSLSLSRTLAVVIGVLVPLGETFRRWNTWHEDPPAIIDDYLLGAFLLWGAWTSRNGSPNGRALLAAAWGFTCGLGYSSFLGQLQRNAAGEVDPAFIPSSWVAVIKGIGLGLAIIGLIAALCHRRSEPG